MKKILVIEDEYPILDSITDLLKGKDYKVIGAQDGRKGLELAKKHLPDLILCDIKMPEMNGYEVLKEIREEKETTAIPFIFITAMVDKESFRYGMELGADDYITKPFGAKELFKAIDARFKKQVVTELLSEKRMNELKYNLASTIPHEFRTPLNAILTSIQFLIDYYRTLQDDEIKHLQDNIYTSTLRLQRLIMNYLFYVELELNYEKAFNNEFRLIPSITNSPTEIVAHIFNKAASKNGRESDIEIITKDNPDILIDGEHFCKICEELSDNAFKFSSQGDSVRVTLKKSGSTFDVFVFDNGRGMESEQLERIGAFVQFDRRFYEQQGSGLGLALVKKLVNIYNGNFEIESKPGSHTTVRISLPVCDSKHIND